MHEQVPSIFQGYDHRLTIGGTVHVHVHVYIHVDRVDTSKLREATADLKDAVAANQPLPPVPSS